MNHHESYRHRAFTIADGDARIRRDDNLMAFRTFAPGEPMPVGARAGDPVRIPRDTVVRVLEVQEVPTGSDSVTVFARVAGPDGATLGWTSARNFDGAFIGETLGRLEPAPGAGRFGPNAAWARGDYLGQITLVRIVGRNHVIKTVSDATAEHLLTLAAAARRDGVAVVLTSGFRTWAEQKFLHDGWVAGRPGFNRAAAPGRSNHQNGIAFDIAVSGGAGNPTYDWLSANATAGGFLRTVSGEPWHWEYRPQDAAEARQAGRDRLPGVTD